MNALKIIFTSIFILLLYLPLAQAQDDSTIRENRIQNAENPVFDINIPIISVPKKPEPSGNRPKRSTRPMRSTQLFVRKDSSITGPLPTDTSKNAENKVLSAFFDNKYPTTLKSFNLKSDLRREMPKNQLNYHLREIRPAWPLLILAVMVLIITVLAANYKKELISILKDVISFRSAPGASIREHNLINSPAFILLLVLAGLAAGILFYYLIPSDTLPFSINGPEIFLLVSGTAAVLYFFKIVLLRIGGRLFKVEGLVQQYLMVLHITTIIVSIAAIPLFFLKALGPPTLAQMALPGLKLLLLFFFVYQYVRSISFFVTEFEFPKIYLIVYLCAFEICPLLILVKLAF